MIAAVTTHATIAVALAAALMVGPRDGHAGAQRYEALSAAVRSALTADVTDPATAEPLWQSRQHRLEWLAQLSARLPRRELPQFEQRIDFLNLVRYEAQRAGLEPELVLGLIQVESGFRRHAISTAGAVGYMQVMPFWPQLLVNGDASQLFSARTNLRYGCLILRHYLDLERGDLFLALGRYNGSRGRAEYPNAVLAASDRWRYQAPAGAAAKDAPD